MKRAVRLVGCIATAVLVCIALPATEASHEETVPPEVTAWLLDQAIPLETTDPTEPLDDLEPIREIIGDAKIIGLGEQTHGTSEFFKMKHRAFRFLVEEMGFRIFAFEADWLGVIELNACLLPGGPEIATAFRNLGVWAWQCDEVMELLQWMKAFNEATEGEDYVQIVGLDIPFYMAMDAVVAARDYLARVAPEESEEARRIMETEFPNALRSLQRAFSAPGASISDPGREEELVRVLGPVVRWMEERQDACIAASSNAEFTLRLRGVELASEILLLFSSKEEGVAQTVRDRVMAENVGWWMDSLGVSRAAIWAHNAHVSRWLGEADSWIQMGYFLDETYGEDYVPVAFSFAEGDFTALHGSSPKSVGAFPPIPGSYEEAFESTGHDRFMLDLRTIGTDPVVDEWMQIERGFRSVGALYYGSSEAGWEYPVVLPDGFDIVIHMKTSTPTAPWIP